MYLLNKQKYKKTLYLFAMHKAASDCQHFYVNYFWLFLLFFKFDNHSLQN